MSPIRTICPLCSVGCGIVVREGAGQAIEIEGDTRHPANRGKLCPRSNQLAAPAVPEMRLRYPEIAGKRVPWDRALARVAKRLADTIARHGPDSVAFLLSGAFTTEDHYVANKLMKGFIGAANIDTFPSSSAAAPAQTQAFGEDVVPATADDLDAADLFLLVGTDVATSHPILFDRIQMARKERGAMLVMIDPDWTESSAEADIHLAIRPDSDVALLNGLLAMAQRAGLIDTAFLASHASIAAGFWDMLAQGSDIWSIARTCAIAPADIQRVFDLFAGNPRTVTLFGDDRADRASAILNLHLATGRIGRPGAAPFPMAGQPNGMGAREAGAIPETLAAHRHFAVDSIAQVQHFWGGPAIATQSGRNAANIVRGVATGQIKFLWVMGSNPMPLHPDIRAALAACPFLIVSDSLADSETGRLAHVRLPAAGPQERNGTSTNHDRLISRQRALAPLVGEARPDWWIMTQVAQVMGWRAAFYYTHPADIYREHARLTAYANDGKYLLDLRRHAAISNPAYDEMTPWRWGGAPFTDGRFPTPDGRARLL